jgi:hypothetical protein
VFNWLQVRMSGEDIKVKMGNKARNGGTVGRAKVGYLNVRKRIEGREVRTIETDPERAPHVVMAFEAFATGKYTVASLRTLLTEAGLRMRATAKHPTRPISQAQLGDLLRDRYYLGYVTYDGIEYAGRHEALIDLELFERVQKVLDSHSGSGTRTRTHNHYLKGLLWCGRCGCRFIVQRAKGNGGEYFYFYCRGRQQGQCDQPYMNVLAVEEAVARHFATVTFPEEFKAKVRAGLDVAVQSDTQGTEALRTRLTERLAALDTQETNLIDLAADRELPKAKIREKLIGIRNEREQIQQEVVRLDSELDVGRQVFEAALALLDRPRALYEQAGPALRRVIAQAIFTKLKVDGRMVTDEELAEPYDVLVPAGRAYYRKDPLLRDGVGFHEGMSADGLTSTDLLQLALWGTGWSKPVMVELRGFEPLTPSMRTEHSAAQSA